MENEARPPRRGYKYWIVAGVCLLLTVAIVAGILFYNAQQSRQYTSATFAMDTMVTQSAYGPHAAQAMQQVNVALAEYENRLSMFKLHSDIVAINASAGGPGVEVAPETADLLRQAVLLSAQSKGAFAITIAPLTKAWGITGGNPHVPQQSEIEVLLPLVDDEAVQIDGNVVTLPEKGMAIDLGGIAKGAACAVAAEIYTDNKVESALLSIGGNIYVKGTKPDGSQYRIGFRDPTGPDGSYIASFCMEDSVIAVSGGYERFFEQDGKTYIHIINPQTGWPAESDIVSVGVLHADGAVADFYSTTLFVWGREGALQFMQNGGVAILLDDTGTLYVSESLRGSFKLNEGLEESYNVVFVPGG